MTNEILKYHLDLLLSSRQYPKTICPSEVPRSLSALELHNCGASHWRDLMPDIRQILWEMRDRGEVEILQGGSPLSDEVSVEDVKGPIRARLRVKE